MSLSPSAYDVAQWLQQTSLTALSDCGREPISTSYVGSGAIAWDDCCGTLVVVPERIFRSSEFPNEDTNEVICFDGLIAIEFSIMLLRCLPNLDERGRAPSQAALDQAYAALLGDAAVIYNAVTGQFPDYWERTNPSQTFLGAQGGCAGVETRLIIGLEQSQFGICCAEPEPHEPGGPVCKFAASNVRFEPCDGLSSENVQDAICELADRTTPDYGAFHSDIDMQASINTPTPIPTEITDLSSGISVVASSQITVSRDGIYNLQFSSQIHNRGGGGSGEQIDIWLAKNGNAVPATATRMIVPNGRYSVAAWNFMIQLDAGDYLELIYYTNNANIVVEHVPAAGVIPSVPSTIITVTQIREL